VSPKKQRDLTELSPEELAKREQELREELFKLRMAGAVSQVPNPSRIRQARREIARVLTVRRQGELRQGTGRAAAAGRTP